jgi:hypothetical protein
MKIRISSVVLVLGMPAAASANGGVEPDEPRISDGIPVETCGWPTAVAVQGGGLCTGTLVAPNLVVYAAHCGGGQKTLRFAENTFSGESVVSTFCMTNPAYSYQGNDWAFCVLPENVDLPVTPVVYGCETSIIVPGAQIAIVGFGGNTDQGGAGTKRWGMTTLLGVNVGQNITQIGGNGEPSICPGDSGGPTMIQYPDGTWHAFGIASTYNGTCGSGGIHSYLPGAVSWVEENSGVDITPCHDVDGTWNPTPRCQQFHSGGAEGTGTWSDWCAGTPAGGSSATCGPAFDAEPDPNAPSVAITSPMWGDEFDPGEVLMIAVTAMDQGWGVKQVAMKIQGELQAVVDEEPPYEFGNVAFPAGTWELVAVAEDWAGNIGESEPVKIGVGGPVMEDPGEGDETGGDGTGTGDTGDVGETGVDADGDGGTSDEGPGMDEGGGGCGCAAAPRGIAGLGLLPVLSLLRRRCHAAP